MRGYIAKLLIIHTIYLLIFTQSIVSAKRVALVIGNGSYKDTPLKNPINDANDMATYLKQLGFEMVKETNANLRSMHEALDKFSLTLKKGDVALFFYAGHGVQVQGENYLLPIGYRISSINDIRYESLHLGRVLGRMEDAKSMNIIMLDACRNNPLDRGFSRSLDRGLAVISMKPEGSIVAYATAPGKTAADGMGRNGLFTSALLKHMKTPGLSIEKLIKKVRVDVKQKSYGQQIPWSESSLTVDFYLAGVGKNKQLSTENTQIPQTSDRMELSFWESIKNSNDDSMFKAYLNQYPNGTFASIARIKIKKQTDNLDNNGLILHYSFDSNANDESGNVNHGSMHNSVTSTYRLFDSFIDIIHSIIQCDRKHKNFYEIVSLVWRYLIEEIHPYYNCFWDTKDQNISFKQKVNKIHSFIVLLSDDDIIELVNYIYNNFWLPKNYLKKKLESIIDEIKRTPNMGSKLKFWNKDYVICNIERNNYGRMIFHPLNYRCAYYLNDHAEEKATFIQKFFFRQGNIFKSKFLLATNTFIKLIENDIDKNIAAISSKKRLEITPLSTDTPLSNKELLTDRISRYSYKIFTNQTNWSLDNNCYNEIEIIDDYVYNLSSLSKIAYAEWLNNFIRQSRYRVLTKKEKEQIKLDPKDSSFFRLVEKTK